MNNSIEKRCARYLMEEPDGLLREQIESLQKSSLESAKLDLADRMSHFLQFGTAGLRARMQAGDNRLNLVSVYRFSYGLFVTLKDTKKNDLKVVVGFDIRHHSQKFAQEVTDVLTLLGIKVCLFKDYVPTPLCAYATKKLGADAGVMITASHNPHYDNGIKVFKSDSSQATSIILQKIEANMQVAPLRQDFYNSHMASPLSSDVQWIGGEIFDEYLKELQKTRLFNDQDIPKNLKIVYSPLHGVGKKFFTAALSYEGFADAHVVGEQSEPDARFPSVEYPNPEEAHTLDLAHAHALKINSDWVFANDPDADRLQISCRELDHTFRKLTGNEMGIILAYFILKKSIERSEKPLVATSIVSSLMLKKMAQHFKADYIDASTGFGNIVQRALQVQKKTGCQFVFAYEEAIGFLVGSAVLDKDGISASVRFLEIACYLHKKGLSVWEFLDQLYEKFGVFANCQWTIRYDGVTAKKKMAQVMTKVRDLDALALAKMVSISECRKLDLIKEQNRGRYSGINADVVIFEKEHEFRLIIRPSGTEPKIKVYLENIQTQQSHLKVSDVKKELSQKEIKQRALLADFLTIED